MSNLADHSENMNEGMPSIMLTAQYVLQSQTSTVSPAFLVQQSQGNIKPELKVHVHYESLGNNLYRVSMPVSVTIGADPQAQFRMNMTYVGEFLIENANEHTLPLVLFVQCPHILFPEVRSVVMHQTQQAGLAPMCIHPIDFAAMYHHRVQEQANKN